MIKNLMISFLLGMLPEIIYFVIFIITIKNIKERKKCLFLLITLAYVLGVIFLRYKTIFYFSFIFIVYAILKILYKNRADIMDISAMSISTLYLTIISGICYMCIHPDDSNYWLLYLLNRILMFLPFIFSKTLRKLYQKCRSVWNRNRNKNEGIKSITVRNTSILIIAIFIAIVNVGISIKLNM